MPFLLKRHHFSKRFPKGTVLAPSFISVLFPGVPSLNRSHSEIDQTHLSIEAQCGTTYLPGDLVTATLCVIFMVDRTIKDTSRSHGVTVGSNQVEKSNDRSSNDNK